MNRISARLIAVLSFVALTTVLTGYFQAPQADEGTAAHVFQLTIVMLAAALMLYAWTADWQRPRQVAMKLALPATALAGAFGALYYLEHYFYLTRR